MCPLFYGKNHMDFWATPVSSAKRAECIQLKCVYDKHPRIFFKDSPLPTLN